MKIFIIAAVALAILAGCSTDSAVPTPPAIAAFPPTVAPTAVVVAETATTVPTSTPPSTPLPTPSPIPTSTPVPTPVFVPGQVILPTVAIPTRTATPEAIDLMEETIRSIASKTSLVRELFFQETLVAQFITRDELNIRLREDLEEDRDEFYETQELYIILGILDPGTDYLELLIGVLGENVLGYFDPEKEELYVVQDVPGLEPIDVITIAHEYVHGLQQQQFDIHTIRESVKGNSDRARAVSALLEGDATLAQFIYVSVNLDPDEQEQVFAPAEDGETTNIDSAPFIVQRSISFPYFEGPTFVYSLYLIENSWERVNQAFDDLPKSTEQILHPEKYVFGDDPLEVNLPDFTEALGEGWSELNRDTLGEFILLAYLETGGDFMQAAVGAAGWGGDTYSLLKGPEDETLLVSQITWDTEEDATEFFDVFMVAMSDRNDVDWNEAAEGDTFRIMELPSQIIYINLNAPDTTLIYAANEDTLGIAREVIAGSE